MVIRTKGIRPLTYSNNEHSLADLAIRDLKNTTALDLSFQSEGRWDQDHKSNYISNVLMGNAPSKIVVCDIKSCLESCEPGSKSYEYFYKWKEKGFHYISIDGNNRTTAIDLYLNDKVKIKHGDYQLPNGKIEVIDEKNDTWSKHSIEFRKFIQDYVKLSITVYENCNRQDLTNLFISINDGISLNAQELRNAILCNYGDWVRETTKKHYINMLSKVYPTVKQKNRRIVDTFIVCMSIFTTYGISKAIQSAEMNNAYEDDSTVSQSTKRAETLINSFSNFIKKNSDSNLKESPTLFNLFMLYVYLYDNNFTIVNEKSFYDWFISSENKRLGDTKTIITHKNGESRTYLASQSSMQQLELKGRYDYIIKDLSSIIGSFVKKKDDIRLFSKDERYKIWERQKGICPLTKKIIPESEINNDSKWHADHIIPHSKGGKTTIENGQLIDKLSNLQKSNKLSLN